jgi:hypothetical protein
MVRRSHRHRTYEIAIPIAGPQLLLRLRPRRGDVTTAHDVVRLYFKYIGEVATQRYLKLKIHARHTVVGQVEVLVQSPADQPADNETKCAGRNDAVRGRYRSIRKINSRGVGRYRASIEEIPRLAVRVNGPTVDDSRVEEIESLLAGRVDLSIGFTYQYRLAVVDRNLVRTNLNLEGHRVFPAAADTIFRRPDNGRFPKMGRYGFAV